MSQEEIERLMQGGDGVTSGTPQPMVSTPQAAPMAGMPQTVQGMNQAASQVQAGQAVPQVQAGQPQVMYAQPAVDSTMMNNMMQMMDMMRKSLELQQQQIRDAAPRKLKVHTAAQPNLTSEDGKGSPEDNLDMILGVPLEVSVEIGRTRKLVKDILELNKGSLVVLDKLAGEQVDLFVNGQCIAKGDVVVVDDNFGIRITDIM